MTEDWKVVVELVMAVMAVAGLEAVVRVVVRAAVLTVVVVPMAEVPREAAAAAGGGRQRAQASIATKEDEDEHRQPAAVDACGEGEQQCLGGCVCHPTPR